MFYVYAPRVLGLYTVGLFFTKAGYAGYAGFMFVIVNPVAAVVSGSSVYSS